MRVSRLFCILMLLILCTACSGWNDNILCQIRSMHFEWVNSNGSIRCWTHTHTQNQWKRKRELTFQVFEFQRESIDLIHSHMSLSIPLHSLGLLVQKFHEFRVASLACVICLKHLSDKLLICCGYVCMLVCSEFEFAGFKGVRTLKIRFHHDIYT